MPTIRVCGDVVRNNILIQRSGKSLPHSFSLPSTYVYEALGGAIHLAEVIGVACDDLREVVLCGIGRKGELIPRDGLAPASTLSILSRYRSTKDSREWVWRVEQFLRASWVQRTRINDEMGWAISGGRFDSRDAPRKASGTRSRSQDVLVIDDEGFGFRDESGVWTRTLANGRPHPQIVLKTRAPLGVGPLWRTLIEKHADRLTVVVPVSSLRARHAAIARGLSWDRAIEDLHRELLSGRSADDLALAHRLVIPFSLEGVAVFVRVPGKQMELERFVFHPEQLEGATIAKQPGTTFGGTSILTAAIVRHLIDPSSYPLYVALSRALVAMGLNHQNGFGKALDDHNLDKMIMPPFLEDEFGKEDLQKSLHYRQSGETKNIKEKEIESRVSSLASAIPDRLLSSSTSSDQSIRRNMLIETVGKSRGHMLTIAMYIVISGLDKALPAVPKAQYGNFLTVDREEIERIEEIARLLASYRENSDSKPLSIAVFGPPGAGKSFAIKELAREMFGEDRATLEWNLSQFDGPEDLRQAFDEIRDASVKGKVPIVFWDEFDSNSLKWLSSFLTPMQDAQYYSGGISRPLGKVVFIFAGGVYRTFRAFNRSGTGDREFQEKKGPDFVSRLRGYLNVKGPNPEPSDDQSSFPPGQDTYLIRRALLLRSVITRTRPHLFDPATGTVSINPKVLKALLQAEEFHHGARSLEALVGMSDLGGSRSFGLAELPSPELLSLHVSADFMTLVEADSDAEAEAAEFIASAYKDSGKVMESLVHDPDEESARHWARLLIEHFRETGYHLVHVEDACKLVGSPEHRFAGSAYDSLVRLLHGQWMRSRLLEGYSWGEKFDAETRVHPAVLAYDDLPQEERLKISKNLNQVLDSLWSNGFDVRNAANH